jgi:hypothetical protein
MGLAAVASFLILLVALHFIEPAFHPSKRLISEYELGRYGWVMSLAFFSLGAGVLAMLWSTGNAPTVNGLDRTMVVCSNRCRPLRSRDLLSLHVRQPRLAIHGLSGAIVIATFPIAATLYGSALARRQDWMAARRLLRWATVLVWLGLLSFAGSTVVLRIISQPVDRSNPNLLIGWQCVLPPIC